MSTKFLANTALAAVFLSKDAIYTYAQYTSGQLVEIKGQIPAPSVGDLRDYSAVDGSPKRIPLPKTDKNPKLFTPLAAACTSETVSNLLPSPENYLTGYKRYVFYVDKDNYLSVAYTKNETDSWTSENLCADEKKVTCAAYSKLAAVKIADQDGRDVICVYYQGTDDSGDILLVNLKDSKWKDGDPKLCDPPLFGTALAAVKPVPGTQSSDSAYPVVFYQQNTLVLTYSQDNKNPAGKGFSWPCIFAADSTVDVTPYGISNKGEALSGHGYIAAVEDGANNWCFYTSDDNYVREIGITKKGLWMESAPRVGLDRTAVPGSPLAAVLSVQPDVPENIVLFYLLRDTDKSINIYASTLTRVSAADIDRWSASPGVSLTA